MNRPAVFHAPRGVAAYPVGPAGLRVTLRTAKGNLAAATAVYGDRYSSADDRQTPLTRNGWDSLYDYWTGILTLPTRRFRYAFLLDDGRETAWLGEGGFREERPAPGDGEGHFHYPYLYPLPEPPAWAQDAIYYQVFLDRFARGSPGEGGGDLSGLLERLPYLADLGVTCLYLSPIFLAPSNHRYDTADYYQVDPRLGDAALARRLVGACHDLGLRVVLDAVLNHCGEQFFAFRDVRERGERSPYAAWFNVEGFPVRSQPRPNYETFGAGHATLPKLRTDNPEVREYLVGAVEHWTRELDVDGWRLDVADEVEPGLWRELRRRLNAVKPGVLLAGEITHDASRWLDGGELDCVMNYPFRTACVDFFAERSIDAAEFAARLTRLRARHRESVNRANLNLLGSHDTPRFLTLSGGDRRRLALAADLQFTFPGAPYVYYGDEVGLEGGGDPDCRRCMVWDPAAQDRELLAHFRRLAHLRHAHPVLAAGDFAFICADPERDLLAYLRWDDREAALVALNNGLGDAVLHLDDLLRRTQENTGLVLAPEPGSRGALVLPPLTATVRFLPAPPNAPRPTSRQ